MITLLLAMLIGVVAGLRTFTAPAAVSWAAHCGWLQLGSTPLAFMGYAWTPWILTVLALVEFVVDQLPSTASGTVPAQFGARIIAPGAGRRACRLADRRRDRWDHRLRNQHARWACGPHEARRRLPQGPAAAFIEDAVAILAAVVIVMVIR